MNKNFFRLPGLIYYWAPPLFWTFATLALSGDLGSFKNTLGLIEWLFSWIPGLGPAQIKAFNVFLRKAGHFLAYGALYFLWYRAFHGHQGYGRGKAFLWAVGLSLGLALADEGHQSLLPSRSGSLWDVALDMSGVTLSALMSAILWTRRVEPATSPRFAE